DARPVDLGDDKSDQSQCEKVGWEDSLRSAHVEVPKIASCVLVLAVQQNTGNQKPAQNEKQVDTHPGHGKVDRVIQEHEQEGDGPQSVKLRDSLHRWARCATAD